MKDKGSSKIKMPMGGVDKSTSGTPGMTPQKMGGSKDNLSHSINGATAQQGRSKGGKTDRFD